jgi:signal peptidase
MQPTLNTNDLVVANHNIQFEDLKVGDIIILKTYGIDQYKKHEIIIHRVQEIVYDANSGNIIVKTKGDANPSSIPSLDYPIYKYNYIGKLVYTIPKFGVFSNIFKPPINYIIIMCSIVVIVYYLRKLPAKKVG